MYNEMRRAAWTEISLANIKENYLAIRRLAQDSEVIACIKANAYGHGSVKVAWELIREGVDYLGVATLDEATLLRSAGILTKIVLLSAVPRGNTKDVIDLGIIPTITSYKDAQLLSEAAVQMAVKNKCEFFVTLETGMGRLGFMSGPEALGDITAISSLPGVHMLGVFSHFATADEPDLSFSYTQLNNFNAIVALLREAGVRVGKRTMANSAAIMALPESHFDIVRPGISLYGIYPSETVDNSIVDLKPAMSVKANIVYMKKVPSGFPVSYGSRFVTERESLIATLPLGYGDGVPRVTTGKARILVRGQYAPIVGTICMDLCMADVTDVSGVSEYDEAVLMGEQDGLYITAEEIAANSGTIPYEVTCRFGQRLPHYYT